MDRSIGVQFKSMVRSIKFGSKRGYFTKNSRGKSIEINRDGSIKEYHEKWDDPIPEPERQTKSKQWRPPFIQYEHPPDYLVPLGRGFYMTPDTKEIKDPQNCNGNLSDISPWCGGNPFTRDALALNPEIKFDECNVWVELQPAIAFVKLAPVQFAYRFPGECRNEPPHTPEPPPPPTPGEIQLRGMDKFTGVDDEEYVYAMSCWYGTDNRYNASAGHVGIELVCPGERDPARTQYTVPVHGISTAIEFNGFTHEIKTYYNELYAFYWRINDEGKPYSYTYTGQTEVVNPEVIPSQEYWDYEQGFTSSTYITYGKARAIKASLLWAANNPENDPNYSSTLTVIAVVYPGCKRPNKYKKNPPPPPERDKPCCMACCNPPPDNSDLLRKILAAVEKANKAIGSDDLPAPFRKVLNRNDDSTEQIENLAQLGKRLAVYIDGVIGEVPIKMKFKDTDATTEGDQSAEMEIDNLAELGAESFGVLMSTSINSELLIQLISKALIELSITRKQLHTTQSKIEAMEKYFGYDVREDKQNVPFTISVPQSSNINDFSMDDFLKPSEQPVEIAKIAKSEIGANKKYMLMLQKTSQIINAVFWRKLVKGGVDLADQMRSILKKENDIVDNVDKHDNELQAFLEDYERGFTDYTGYQGDISQPYGESYEQRPKTRIIKKPDTPTND